MSKGMDDNGPNVEPMAPTSDLNVKACVVVAQDMGENGPNVTPMAPTSGERWACAVGREVDMATRNREFTLPSHETDPLKLSRLLVDSDQ